jgi:DNA invertase Pin-like site-specific DNA recombinase
MIAIGAWIAKQERTRISERVRAGLSRAKERGTRSGNPVERPKVILDGQKVADLGNQGRSWRKIARACDVVQSWQRRMPRKLW